MPRGTAFREIGPVIRFLMLGSPPKIETRAVVDTVRGVDGITGIHHAHSWQMDEHHAALDAHVVIEEGHWDRADAIKEGIKTRLAEAFGIEHKTLKLECARHACGLPSGFGGRGHDEVSA